MVCAPHAPKPAIVTKVFVSKGVMGEPCVHPHAESTNNVQTARSVALFEVLRSKHVYLERVNVRWALVLPGDDAVHPRIVPVDCVCVPMASAVVVASTHV